MRLGRQFECDRAVSTTTLFVEKNAISCNEIKTFQDVLYRDKNLSKVVLNVIVDTSHKPCD